MKAVVSFSGGMDSATVLATALAEGRDVYPVTFQYPSKHNYWEREAAGWFLKAYCEDGVRRLLKTIDVTSVFEGFSSNLLRGQGPIPEGHYEAASMSQTVVPGRNIIFASILAGYAWSIGADEVWMGMHAGDHAIYPDCRPDFYYSMKRAIEQGTDNKVCLRAPFLLADKAYILDVGHQLNVPYELTRTCYTDQQVACGKCGSCQERLAAFEKIGREDPLNYVSRTIMPKT